MIEGLRLLPWWHEAMRRRPDDPRSKCETCMETYSEHDRQLYGCAYLRGPEEKYRAVVAPYRPLGCKTNPTICPGYTTALPEVVEIARGRLHWSKGGPAALGITDWHEHPLTIGIEILDGSSNECEHWSMKNQEKSS